MAKPEARLARAIKIAENARWRVGRTKRNHIYFRPPPGLKDQHGRPAKPVYFAGTSSDFRGDKNGLAALRRAGLDV